MAKGPWKKEICRCGACKKCKDREYRKGNWKKRIPKGRKDEQDRRERRMLKELAKNEREQRKLLAQERRKIRSEAVKHNIERYGKAKALFIATIVDKKMKGTFKETVNDKVSVHDLGFDYTDES